MRPIYLVLFVNIAIAGVAYWTYAMGQVHAPEIMASDAVKPPMILGLVSIALWLTYWSVRMLRRPGRPK